MENHNVKNHLSAKRNPRLAPFSVFEEQHTTTSYDFIIIGAGSAGCIVASNLAASFPDKTILLVEAGPPIQPTDQTVWDPTQWVLVSQDASLEWGYRSTPQAGLANRVIPMGRAKGLGGCSIHNAMVYVRGGKKGFDHWAEEGNHGWDYDSVLPYFKEIEAKLSVNIIPDDKDPFIGDLIHACNNKNLPFNSNYNEITDIPCVSFMQFAIASGKRETTASVFLSNPPSNLTIVTNHLVEKIIIDKASKTAKSIVISSTVGTTQTEISANNEIILSAGAIGSPHILMLSGIGPQDELARAGIDPIQHLAGVGKNFQDDLYVTTWFKSKKPMPIQPYGLMGAIIFDNSPYNDAKLGTDIECSLAAGTMVGLNLPPEKQQSWLIYPNIQLLKSRGTITLASDNPGDAPIIDPNYLSDPSDIINCVSAVKLALSIGEDSGLANWYDETLLPASTSDLEDYVRGSAGTCYHYAGTCKMGPATDLMAVVTPDLKVIGINNLRVIDSSVIPTTVSGNTAGATMMIAQKGSAMISSQQIKK